MPKNNKSYGPGVKTTQVVESLIVARSRSDAGLVGQRLMIRLVEYAQMVCRGDNFAAAREGKVITYDWGGAAISLPITSLFPDTRSTNYTYVRNVLSGLAKMTLTYQSDDKWIAITLFSKLRLAAGTVDIEINRHFWKILLDYSRGYVYYDPDIAVKLRRESSIRIYKSLTGTWRSKRSIQYSFAKLRVLLGVEPGRYKKDGDLVALLVKPAREELDAVADYTFDYSVYYNDNPGKDDNPGKRGRRKALGIVITPKRNYPAASTSRVAKMSNANVVLDRDVRDMLFQTYGFNYSGLSANLILLNDAIKYLTAPVYLDYLRDLAPKALRSKNPAGYVITSTRKYLQTKFNYTVDADADADTKDDKSSK